MLHTVTMPSEVMHPQRATQHVTSSITMDILGQEVKQPLLSHGIRVQVMSAGLALPMTQEGAQQSSACSTAETAYMAFEQRYVTDLDGPDECDNSSVPIWATQQVSKILVAFTMAMCLTLWMSCTI